MPTSTKVDPAGQKKQTKGSDPQTWWTDEEASGFSCRRLKINPASFTINILTKYSSLPELQLGEQSVQDGRRLHSPNPAATQHHPLLQAALAPTPPEDAETESTRSNAKQPVII